jgi:hypothetical protein
MNKSWKWWVLISLVCLVFLNTGCKKNEKTGSHASGARKREVPATAWDRAGKLWKVWWVGWAERDLSDGDKAYPLAFHEGVDVQFRMGESACLDVYLDKKRWSYEDNTPSGLIRFAR